MRFQSGIFISTCLFGKTQKRRKAVPRFFNYQTFNKALKKKKTNKHVLTLLASDRLLIREYCGRKL